MGNKSYSITTGSTFDMADARHCRFFVSSTGKSKKASLGQIFDEADTNGNGQISYNELKTFFKKKGVYIWSETQFREMFRDADDNSDAQINFLEFKNVMNAAKSSYSTHHKWRELLDTLDAQSGTSTETKLFRIDGHSNVLVAGGTSDSYSRNCFHEGSQYYITLNETDTHNNMELARTDVFECVDSDAFVRKRLATQLARDRAAARSLQAKKVREAQILMVLKKKQSMKRKADRTSLEERIKQRMMGGSSKRPMSRNAAVVIDQVFDEIDTNGNGKISMNELRSHINEKGCPITLAEVARMFREADKNSDAQLSKSEFRKVMRDAKNASSTSEWNDLYELHENRVAPSRSAKRRRIAR